MKLYPAFLKEITKYINQNDTIVIGVSGGPDSMALFKLLISISKKYNLKIIAAHFNHMLRGAESAGYGICKRSAKSRRGILLREKDINALNKNRFCTEKPQGRAVQIFIETAVKYKAGKIALAQYG